MGDFVKGRVDSGHPHYFQHGVVLHRKIDSFAQQHPLFHRSRQRLADRYGLYRGAMVDLFYDHFLSVEWPSWSTEPLDVWLARSREIVETHLSQLPERLQPLVPVIFEELLPSYREIAGIGSALERMSRRIRRPNPLAGGERELVAHYEELRHDFRDFMPAAVTFTEKHLALLT
jgi:acyl carrier protein phosphodiesterase